MTTSSYPLTHHLNGQICRSLFSGFSRKIEKISFSAVEAEEKDSETETEAEAEAEETREGKEESDKENDGPHVRKEISLDKVVSGTTVSPSTRSQDIRGHHGLSGSEKAETETKEKEGSYGGKEHEVGVECLEPFVYLTGCKGKEVRSHLLDCFQAWLQIPSVKLTAIKGIVSDLHNASLLIDDIEDSSTLRRGKPCAHLVYGVASTLNAGNYVYFLALQKVLTLSSGRMEGGMALQVFTTEILNLHRGQGREIVWRENAVCPSVEEYTDMILDKTGGLFRLAVGLMLSCSSSHAPSRESSVSTASTTSTVSVSLETVSENEVSRLKSYERLVNLLSIYFQVRDDYINLANPKYFEKKTFCEDITEGKFSFPIIHGLTLSKQGAEESRENVEIQNRLLNILKQRTTDKDLKVYFVEVLKNETKSFEYTRLYLGEVRDKIYKEIEELGGHALLMKLMERLEEEVEECDC